MAEGVVFTTDWTKGPGHVALSDAIEVELVREFDQYRRLQVTRFRVWIRHSRDRMGWWTPLFEFDG